MRADSNLIHVHPSLTDSDEAHDTPIGVSIPVANTHPKNESSIESCSGHLSEVSQLTRS